MKVFDIHQETLHKEISSLETTILECKLLQLSERLRHACDVAIAHEPGMNFLHCLSEQGAEQLQWELQRSVPDLSGNNSDKLKKSAPRASMDSYLL